MSSRSPFVSIVSESLSRATNTNRERDKRAHIHTTIRSDFRDVFDNKHTSRFDIIFCRGKYDRIMIKKIYVYKRRGKNESPMFYVKCIKYFC